MSALQKGALLLAMLCNGPKVVAAADQLKDDCHAIQNSIRINTTPPPLYNILAIDGGGIRGLIPG